jgi:hypothetical protein
MLPYENRERNFSHDEGRFQQYSVVQQYPEQDRRETIELNSISPYRSGQHTHDPNRLIPPLYAAQPQNVVSQSPKVAPLRRNKAHVPSACVNCKKAHLACDGKYPHANPCFRLSKEALFALFIPSYTCDQPLLQIVINVN